MHFNFFDLIFHKNYFVLLLIAKVEAIFSALPPDVQYGSAIPSVVQRLRGYAPTVGA